MEPQHSERKRVPFFVCGGEESKRPRGRPRVSEPRSWVSTKLPVSYHDRLIQMAAEKDVSVSMLVRSMLMLQLRKK